MTPQDWQRAIDEMQRNHAPKWLTNALARQKMHLDYGCSKCGAPPGKPCMTPEFRPTQRAHSVRGYRAIP